MAWTTAPAFVAGNTLTAGQLNILGGDINIAGGAWTADGRASSTIWQAASTNPVLGNGTIVSRYLQTGKTVNWLLLITAGSSTTFGTGQMMLVLPVAPFTTGGTVPLGMVVDSSTNNRYPLFATIQPTTLNLHALVSTAPTTNTTASSPMAWATGDVLSVEIEYETT